MNTKIESQLPPKPDKCHNCGGTQFWWLKSTWGKGGVWRCSRCCPNPNEGEVRK